MKKVVMLLVLLVAIPMTASAGGIWGMVKNSGIPIKQTKPFVIEVSGVNIRGYIFDVPEISSRCISVWGEDTQQLECKTYKEIAESDDVKPTK